MALAFIAVFYDNLGRQCLLVCLSKCITMPAGGVSPETGGMSCPVLASSGSDLLTRWGIPKAMNILQLARKGDKRRVGSPVPAGQHAQHEMLHHQSGGRSIRCPCLADCRCSERVIIAWGPFSTDSCLLGWNELVLVGGVAAHTSVRREHRASQTDVSGLWVKQFWLVCGISYILVPYLPGGH